MTRTYRKPVVRSLKYDIELVFLDCDNLWAVRRTSDQCLLFVSTQYMPCEQHFLAHIRQAKKGGVA